MDKFKLVYYETQEHIDGEVGNTINDTFYTLYGAISRAEDLMFRKMYVRIEVYEMNDSRPQYVLNLSKFNRKEFHNRKN